MLQHRKELSSQYNFSLSHLSFSAYPPTPLYVEAITEERANRCIARIDLLSKIREEIIVHPKFDERIDMCKSSYDLPEWWISGKHDRELLIGAAK